MNHDKTLCVPVPGGYVPVIFLIASGVWTTFLLFKYPNLRHQPLPIISQLLLFYTSIQTIVYIIMFALSISLNYVMVQAIHIITIIPMWICNIAFSFYIHWRARKSDTPFLHWSDLYRDQYKIVRYVTLIWHFKSFRVIWS